MKLIIDLVISLKKVNLFSEIPEHILAEVAGIIEIFEIDEGETFISKGELGECLYIIQDGKVRVHDGNQTFATLQQNDIVGELALLAPVERTADVTTMAPCTLFKIERDYFQDLLFGEPEMVKGILNVLVERIINLNKELMFRESTPESPQA